MTAGHDYRRILKAIRVALGLTQKQLAEKLGVSFATVNGWENGRHEPMPVLAASIATMAAAAGVSEAAGSRLGPAKASSTRKPRRRRSQ